jgi:antitoxin component YwqK of YwqJK toxin-antitoxin module
MKRLLLIVLPLFISLGFSQQLFTVVDTDEGNNVKITYYKETQNKLEKVKYKEYYPNGQKSSEGTYKDGNRDGLVTGWYENGQKEFEGTYKDGIEDGKWIWWHRTGNKWYETTYKDGMKISLKEWNEDGSVMK